MERTLTFISTKINMMVVGIIATILWRYPVVDKVYYLFLVFLFVMLMANVFNKDLELRKNNLPSIVSIIFALFYFLISTLYAFENREVFLTRYSLLIMVVIYLYASFSLHGIKYAEKIYRQLTVLLNVFSVLNLYQVIFHKPLLLDYMRLIDGYGFDFYQFGTFAYRTMSVFNHPIISGLFFIVAFLCNIYILKTPWKYLLQFLLLINIYTSWSRSAWLILVIVLVLYAILNFKKFGLTFNIKLNYRKLFNIYISIVLIGIGIVVVAFNFDSLFNNIISRFGDSLSSNSTDGSNLQRTMTMSLILNHMFESDIFHLLFGYGIGTAGAFMLEHPILIEGFATTDNQYLAWFYEFGLIGVLSYFFILFFLFFKYLKKKKSWLIELSFLCLIVLSLEFFFFEAVGWPVVFIMLAIVISCLSFNFKSNEYYEHNKSAKAQN